MDFGNSEENIKKISKEEVVQQLEGLIEMHISLKRCQKLEKDDLALFVWHSRTIYNNMPVNQIANLYDLLLQTGCTFKDLGLKITEKDILKQLKDTQSSWLNEFMEQMQSSDLRDVLGNDYPKMLGFNPCAAEKQCYKLLKDGLVNKNDENSHFSDIASHLLLVLNPQLALKQNSTRIQSCNKFMSLCMLQMSSDTNVAMSENLNGLLSGGVRDDDYNTLECETVIMALNE